MAETYLSLAQELARQVGTTVPAAVTSQTGEALRLVNWINEAYRKVWTLHEGDRGDSWKWIWAEGSFNIAAAVSGTDDERTYTPATVFDDFDRNSLRIYKTATGESDESTLAYVPYKNWGARAEIGVVPTARPSQFTILPNGNIRFDAYPDAQYTIVLDYRKLFTALAANTDEPLMPDKYRFVIVYKAKEYYAIWEEAEAMKADANRQYIELLRDMEWTQLPEDDVVVRPE